MSKIDENDFFKYLRDPTNGKELKKIQAISGHVYCLLPSPELALGHFLTQWHLLESGLKESIEKDSHLHKASNLHPLTQERILNYKRKREEFLLELSQIFSPLSKHIQNKVNDSKQVYEGFGLTIPMAQPLIGHPQNIFRDWKWGETENNFYLNHCLKYLSDLGRRPKKILIIAAGAGRLAFDIHHALNAEMTVALDNSYFFSQCFERICFGEGFKLTEFPLAPLSDENVFQTHVLKAPHVANENLKFVLGDLNYLPFTEESFDLVITPWIIDLIPSTLPFVINNISALLQPSGVWINFGSYFLDHNTPSSYCWSQKEVLGFSEDAGMSLVRQEHPEISYLNSPYSAHCRHEKLWSFCHTKQEPQGRKILRLRNQHPWLVDNKLPIPLNQKVVFSKIQHKVPARVFELIDGKRSVHELSVIMAKDFSLSEQEALASVTQFLTRWSQS